MGHLVDPPVSRAHDEVEVGQPPVDERHLALRRVVQRRVGRRDEPDPVGVQPAPVGCGGQVAAVEERVVGDVELALPAAGQRWQSRRVAGRMGEVSVLVNNAGIARRNGMTGAEDAVIKDWEDIIAINLGGVFNVTHAFLEPLREAKGRIVNIASIQSFVHLRQPSSPAYTASKHGVLGFTKALAAELGKEGVRVNAIGPGFIATPLNAATRANKPELVQMFIDHTPLGRAGTPEDIVGPAIFLASDMSGYVTGSIVMADGGYRTV